MSIEIREVRPDEYEVVGAQTVAAYQALPGMSRLGRYGDELADVAGRIGPGIVLVAVENGEIFGNVTFYERYADEMADQADLFGNDAGFRMLATTPDAQGRGVGRLLTEACIERGRANASPATVLHTTDYMQAAQRLYRRLGFVRFTDGDRTVGRQSPIQVLCFRFAH